MALYKRLRLVTLDLLGRREGFWIEKGILIMLNLFITISLSSSVEVTWTKSSLSEGLSRSERAGPILAREHSIWVLQDKLQSNANCISCQEKSFTFLTLNWSWTLHCLVHKIIAFQRPTVTLDSSMLAQAWECGRGYGFLSQFNDSHL